MMVNCLTWLDLWLVYTITKVSRDEPGGNLAPAGRFRPVASLQARTVRGHKYWYLVESRRVDGKPRPIVLAYLGKADDLLGKLQQASTSGLLVKSYAHGAVAAFLALCAELDLVRLINQFVPLGPSGQRQLRDGLTVGASLLLRTLERICAPCSNRAFADWATGTSLDYLLSISSGKLDSQHFWDQMSVVPDNVLPKIEEAIVQRLLQREQITLDSLLLDATNFFTFIDSTNEHSKLAQRGKNKQGRNNLRQVGVLLVVSRREVFPLLHATYPGNKPDSKIFAETSGQLLQRLQALVGDLEKLTLIFDRGNNSKKNLSKKILRLHYVGALVPSQHPELLREACHFFDQEQQPSPEQRPVCYRVKHVLWQRERTIVVYRSAELYEGQLRGVLHDLEKRIEQLNELNRRLASPRRKERTLEKLQNEVTEILHGQFMAGLLKWQVSGTENNWQINYERDEPALQQLKKTLGLRMLMTDRHEWQDEEIIAAYHSQAWVEQGFRNVKSPYHLCLRPQYHWTDQKVRVHVFTCVLGLLLLAVLYRRACQRGYQPSTYDTFIDKLNSIRLATLLRRHHKSQPLSVEYRLEELDAEQQALLEALNLQQSHLHKVEMPGVVVYD
jgi:transposase